MPPNEVTSSLLVPPDHPEPISIEPQSAVEKDDITLICRASRYLYTDLQWLDSRNRTVTSNVSRLQLDRYSIAILLRLQNVSKNSTVGYKCRASKLQNKLEVKSAALNVIGTYAFAHSFDILLVCPKLVDILILTISSH